MSKSEKKNLSKAKKIYNIVTTVITAVVFVFLVVVLSLTISQRNSGGDASIFGYHVYEVITDSMSGTIEAGEVIISKKVDNVNELAVGDIITFVAPSGPLRGRNETHRIIEVARNEDGSVQYFRTKGDNEQYADNWKLNPSAVKAKFLRKSPFIAGFRRFLSHWYGYVLLIALPLLIVGVLIIVGYVKDKVAAESEERKQPSLDGMSDEEKKKLLESYLASAQKQAVSETDATANNDVEEKAENNSDNTQI